jgi:hypothetical protein
MSTLLFAAMLAGADPLSGQALYADVVTYSNLGKHRTGSADDRKTSKWLADELRKLGAEVQVQVHPYRLRQFFPTAIALKVGDLDMQAFPLWWPKPTGPKPIVGPLVAVAGSQAAGSLAGKIALVKIDDVPGTALVTDSVVHKLLRPVIEAGAAGAVLMTRVPSGELVTLNAPSELPPWPLPVLIVGKAQKAAIDRAATAGASTSLLLDGAYDDRAEADEVVGKIGHGSRTVIVTTPSSGWFHCAGERGPGIALWLGLARWAAQHPSDTTFLFVASSGHEIGGLGVEHFVAKLAPKPADVFTWLHLGAGIAVYDYDTSGGGFRKKTTASPMRRLFCSREYVPVLKAAFADLPDIKPIVTDRPNGEMVVFQRLGYRYWGFGSPSPFHHQPGDLPATSTGPELLEPVGQAILTALATLLDRK